MARAYDLGVEVRVLLFAMLRERAGTRELTIELPEGARVRDALDSLGELANGLPLVMAVNREYAPEDQVLDPGVREAARILGTDDRCDGRLLVLRFGGHRLRTGYCALFP